MKEYKTVQLEKDIHQQLSLMASKNNLAIKDLLTKIVQQFIKMDVPTFAVSETPKDMLRADIDMIKTRLDEIENEMKVGFNMITTNQHTFGKMSKDVNEKLINRMESLIKDEKKR